MRQREEGERGRRSMGHFRERRKQSGSRKKEAKEHLFVNMSSFEFGFPRSENPPGNDGQPFVD